MGQLEEGARAVVARYRGLPVTVHDDGSERGMYDLKIHLGGDRFGAVEVTAAERQDLAATQAAISKKPILNCPHLRSGWLVVLAQNAKVNEARRQLPSILADLEAHSISELTVFHCQEDEEWAVERLRVGHIETAVVADYWEPGFVGITGPMRVEWLSTDPDGVVKFVEDFVARRPSDVAKLAASGADERHLFVWSGVFSEGMAELRALALDVESLPQRAPQLPEAVTHLWVGINDSSRPSRIVHWSPASGWAQAGLVNEGA